MDIERVNCSAKFAMTRIKVKAAKPNKGLNRFTSFPSYSYFQYDSICDSNRFFFPRIKNQSHFARKYTRNVFEIGHTWLLPHPGTTKSDYERA